MSEPDGGDESALTSRLSTLRRWPDAEAVNLFAVDATDRLLLDEAAEGIAAARGDDLVVIDDHYGALSIGALSLGAERVRVHQDRLTGVRALAANADPHERGAITSHGLDGALTGGARLVLVQAPKALSALDEIAEAIAAHADPAVRVVVGGRIKHLSRGMNDVLGEHFTHVHATRARQKSRLLIADGVRRDGPAATRGHYPLRAHDPELDLWVCAHGAAFGGARVDIGTRYLLTFLDRMAPAAAHAVDLGCGTGVLATALARSRPGLQVSAVDESWAAVASARATAEANGVTLTVDRDLSGDSVPTGSQELVVLNPPFHIGTDVDPRVAHRLFRAAGRILRPGGELWTVFNRSLDHADALRRFVGHTDVVGQNAKFVVTRSVHG